MKTEHPLISVVVPCYNHEKYIEECLDSLLNQSYDNIEIFIVNDGSSDNSADVIVDYLRTHKGDIRLHFCNYVENTCFMWQEDVIPKLSGKYIVTLSADDMIVKDRFEKQVDFLENNIERFRLCFSWVKVIDSKENEMLEIEEDFNKRNNEDRYKKIKKYFQYGCDIAGPTMMMDLSVFRELGGFNFNYRQVHDYDLWLRYLLKYDFYIIPEKLTVYRVLESSISNMRDSNSLGREYNDLSNVRYNYIDNMEDELFIKVCNDDNLANSEHSFIIMKKIQFLIECGHNDVAIKLIDKYINCKYFYDTMKNNGVNIRKLYYNIVGKNSLYTEIIRLELYVQQLKMQLYEEKKPDLNKVDNLLDILDSTADGDRLVGIGIEHIDAAYSACKDIEKGNELFNELLEKIAQHGIIFE